MTAQLVAHLAELDTRDVHLREGYDSLYVYCRDALGLSEGESYNRIEAARAARRFPIILEMLVAGAVNLNAARLLAPHLILPYPFPPRRDASAAVNRAVWVRDLGRCKFIGPTGHRCNERRFVESITWTRTRWAARRPSIRSNCAVGVTTITRAGCTSGSGAGTTPEPGARRPPHIGRSRSSPRTGSRTSTPPRRWRV